MFHINHKYMDDNIHSIHHVYFHINTYCILIDKIKTLRSSINNMYQIEIESIEAFPKKGYDVVKYLTSETHIAMIICFMY